MAGTGNSQEKRLRQTMLTNSEEKKLEALEEKLQSFQIETDISRSHKETKKYYETLRSVIELYEGLVQRANKQGKKLQGKSYKKLRSLTGNAIDQLGSQPHPATSSLKNYNHELHGPFLGVSDEGSAAPYIRNAALESPKMKVIGPSEPMVVGVAHDAERLAASGEVAVGPAEYRDIRLSCMGRILTSTNVGTRLNLRYYKQRPVIEIEHGSIEESISRARQQAKEVLEPFLYTPDNTPRPLTIFAKFASRRTYEHRHQILKRLAEFFTSGEICNPDHHKLGLIVSVERGERGVHAAMEAIDLACRARLAEVAISGEVLKSAEDKISMPGLLNYFSPKHVSELLDYANQKEMPVSPRNLVDTDTVSRHVWVGLNVARNMGLELGKYGLFPLTLPESERVMENIQSWFPSWTAAPVFYVDFPTMDSETVYTEKNIKGGLERWLDLVSKHNIPVVLIDTADKDKGRRLLKNSPGDKKGILTLEEIGEIDSEANKLGIRALWAGGITVPQVYEFGKIGVFGLYVTSAAAVSRPVSGAYERDVMLANLKEPTFYGVFRVKLLLEAGFLYGRLLQKGDVDNAKALDGKVGKYLSVIKRKYDKDKFRIVRDELVSIVTQAWQTHFKLFE
ncbi:MAG TPA: hypothetical protein ENH43_02620 [Phycisphaerales bacterium]|nr:hypothetical protein [Phycisphaerales bacterium]